MNRNIAGFFIVLLVLAVAGPAVADNGAEKASEQKAFTVENSKVDIGVVAAGTDGIAVFVFKNNTDKDVKIIRAKPT